MVCLQRGAVLNGTSLISTAEYGAAGLRSKELQREGGVGIKITSHRTGCGTGCRD